MTTTLDTSHAEREEVNAASEADLSGVTKSLKQAIQEAIAQARADCEAKGDSSKDCAVAWDIVEELQAERCHRGRTKSKNSLEQYCTEHPEAVECLIYDL